MTLLNAGIPGMLQLFSEREGTFRLSESTIPDDPSQTTFVFTTSESSEQPVANIFGNKIQFTAEIFGNELDNPGTSYDYYCALFEDASTPGDPAFVHDFTELEMTAFKDLYMIFVWECVHSQ